MKIRRAKFYQAVTMHDGERYRTVTHMDAEKPEIAGKVSMEVLPGVGLLIDTEHDSTLVTLNNVAFMHPVKESKASKVPAPKK